MRNSLQITTDVSTKDTSSTRIAKNSKLSASERLEILFDNGEFTRIDDLVQHRCMNFGLEKRIVDGDGVITGYGYIKGRKVFAYSQDFSVLGGSLSEKNAGKICKIMDLAAKTRSPIIGINDSGGARIQEGVDSLAGYGEIFRRNVQLSGVVPQLSLIMGPCAGGAVYSPALTDFIFMVKNTSYMFVTGPKVVKTVLREDLTQDELGGTDVHTKKSGVCDKAFANDAELLISVRDFIDFLPQNNCEPSRKNSCNDPVDRQTEWLNYSKPMVSNLPYDMKGIIGALVDDGYFFELGSEFAKNILTGFARIGGMNIGIVANQPLVLAGCLDINSSRKAGRFVRFCDAFNIPILTLVDVPGFLPGSVQEQNAIIKHGAKLLYAYAEATVPKVTLIVKKAYGGAYIVMGSKHLASDVNLAWPEAEVAVMGPEAAVEIIFKREISTPGRAAELALEYKAKFANPKVPASRGYIDSIITPADSRRKIIEAFEMLSGKESTTLWKKHDNLPM
ncbi:propionyl-CoA carboxylase, beta subunit [Neorickettsia helminthoeca str. Oregon]|uniref:Propionyl-CoA carboxylase, beta subunit n=1 Tax=Neorickettsia helminthoeca str. Oregon TaxID=1286528 RepID=X5GXA5_9RICK|nr:acyl-CoA carboxylase subunit beta [Neorickettsia helminthoeca]AHX11687.1 propionyl-CoA carboxylase, beta subunit [Neorickettsia helminthoeca str. Oregon]